MKLLNILFSTSVLLFPLYAVQAASVVYSQGHADFRITYTGGALGAGFHFDPGTILNGTPVSAPGGESHASADVITYIRNPSIASPPPEGPWSFTGSAAGQPIWVIPQSQSQDPSKPWLGTNTESLGAAGWDGPLTLTLESVSAPDGGYFSLFTSGAFGEPQVKFDTFDGTGLDDAFTHNLGTHVHYNWLFTQPGLYSMTWNISGTHRTDGFKQTSATLTFGVNTVPEPSAALLGLLGGAGALTLRRRVSAA